MPLNRDDIRRLEVAANAAADRACGLSELDVEVATAAELNVWLAAFANRVRQHWQRRSLLTEPKQRRKANREKKTRRQVRGGKHWRPR